MADESAGTVGSYVEVWVSTKEIRKVHAGGAKIKVGLVVEDSDVDDIVPTARDISTALTIAMVFIDPEGAETTVAAVFADFGGATGDGVDGAIMVRDVSFLTVGTWTIRAEVLLGNGVRFSTDEAQLRVLPAAGANVLFLPETLIPAHRVAWWRELFTVGNPGRLGTWLDMWQNGNLTAVSVSPNGGPAFTTSDPAFGGKTSFLYDELRDLESGVAADWTLLHDGTGVTFWGDVRPDDALEKDSLFGTAWVASQIGVRFEYDGPAGEFVFSIFNGSGTAVHEARFAHPVATRARYAIQWCYDDPSGADLRVYLDGALVLEADTPFTNPPVAGAPQDELHVGEDPSGTSQRFRGRLAELGFIRGCVAAELAAYLEAQP